MSKKDVALAESLFGKAIVVGWLDELGKHFRTEQPFTPFDETLRKTATAAERPRLMLEYVLAELFDRLDRLGPLQSYRFEKVRLTMIPRADATVTYRGETKDVNVSGAIAVECTVKDQAGNKLLKPTLLFVSHPFHQYRAISLGA